MRDLPAGIRALIDGPVTDGKIERALDKADELITLGIVSRADLEDPNIMRAAKTHTGRLSVSDNAKNQAGEYLEAVATVVGDNDRFGTISAPVSPLQQSVSMALGDWNRRNPLLGVEATQSRYAKESYGGKSNPLEQAMSYAELSDFVPGMGAASTALGAMAAIPMRKGRRVAREAAESEMAPRLANYDPKHLPKTKQAAGRKRLATTDNPAVAAREALRSDGQTVMSDFSDERRIITPEDMLGSEIVPVLGDKTLASAQLERIGGVPLSKPVEMKGGPGFSQAHQGTGAAWASMLGAAQAKQNNINLAAKSGNPVVGVYAAMADEGSNFSAHVAKGMVRQMDALDIAPKDIAAFNKHIKSHKTKSKRLEDFPGLDSPDLEDYLLGTGAYSQKGAGDRRKKLIAVMREAQWRDKGLPVYDDTLDAVNDPALKNASPLDSGYTTFDARPNEGLLTEAGHHSYSHDIPGEYKGGLLESVPFEVMFPKTVKHLKESGNQNLFRAVQMAHLHETADDSWLKGIKSYLESNPKAQGAVDPELLTMLGLGSAGAAGLLSLEAQE